MIQIGVAEHKVGGSQQRVGRAVATITVVMETPPVDAHDTGMMGSNLESKLASQSALIAITDNPSATDIWRQRFGEVCLAAHQMSGM